MLLTLRSSRLLSAPFLYSSFLFFSLPQSCVLPASLQFPLSIVIKCNLIVPSHAHTHATDRDLMRLCWFNSWLVSCLIAHELTLCPLTTFRQVYWTGTQSEYQTRGYLMKWTKTGDIHLTIFIALTCFLWVIIKKRFMRNCQRCITDVEYHNIPVVLPLSRRLSFLCVVC